jgi:tetratricopeptide (TPR) repeat protein
VRTVLFACFLIVWAGAPLAQETPETSIERATSLREAGDLEGARAILIEALDLHPDHSTLHAYLGLYYGEGAGETENYMLQAEYSQQAFEHLDQGVELGPRDPFARFFRGLFSVMVPEFLGRLDQGIEDLDTVLDLYVEDPEQVPLEIVLNAHFYLGQAYEKKGWLDRAEESYHRVIELGPETDVAEQAEWRLDEMAPTAVASAGAAEEAEKALQSEIRELEGLFQKDKKNKDVLVRLGKAYMRGGRYWDAFDPLERAAWIDKEDAELQKLLGMAMLRMSAQGYDERIAEDTDFRANQAFRVMEYFDSAYVLDPEDVEIQYLRGSMGIEMPFFVERLDEGIEILERLSEMTVPDSLRRAIRYYLGYGYARKGLGEWRRLVQEDPESEETEEVFEYFHRILLPDDVSDVNPPKVEIEFTLGYQDELAPQAAVWVEDSKGEFIRTVYVSGFAGNVEDGQVTLAAWGRSSGFETDAKTGASIDVGNHAFAWDLTRSGDGTVTPGTYTVFVEVFFWPSMAYEITESEIQVGGDGDVRETETGTLIPYLRVEYVPD